MLRIAIVDDETAEIQKLQELVEQFFREKQVAYQITSYISGETFLVAQQQCDLIFLDVQMTQELTALPQHEIFGKTTERLR